MHWYDRGYLQEFWDPLRSWRHRSISLHERTFSYPKRAWLPRGSLHAVMRNRRLKNQRRCFCYRNRIPMPRPWGIFPRERVSWDIQPALCSKDRASPFQTEADPSARKVLRTPQGEDVWRDSCNVTCVVEREIGFHFRSPVRIKVRLPGRRR